MKFKVGDPVWYTYQVGGVNTSGAKLTFWKGPFKSSPPRGVKIAGVVTNFTEIGYGVLLEGYPSGYPYAPGVDGWNALESQLEPRTDSKYDGNDAGEWDLCPYKPPIKLPVTA